MNSRPLECSSEDDNCLSSDLEARAQPVKHDAKVASLGKGAVEAADGDGAVGRQPRLHLAQDVGLHLRLVAVLAHRAHHLDRTERAAATLAVVDFSGGEEAYAGRLEALHGGARGVLAELEADATVPKDIFEDPAPPPEPEPAAEGEAAAPEEGGEEEEAAPPEEFVGEFVELDDFELGMLDDEGGLVWPPPPPPLASPGGPEAASAEDSMETDAEDDYIEGAPDMPGTQ